MDRMLTLAHMSYWLHTFIESSLPPPTPSLCCRTEVLDCSALDGHNIRQIFRTFLALAKIGNPLILTASAADDGGLKRNLSAYGRLKSPR